MPGETAAPPTGKRPANGRTKKSTGTATAASDDEEYEAEGAFDEDVDEVIDTTEKKKARKTKAKAKVLDVEGVAAQRKADLLLFASGAIMNLPSSLQTLTSFYFLPLQGRKGELQS